MRILTRKEFIDMPKETLFSYYEPCCFHNLMIKTSDKSVMDFDFYTDSLIGAIDHGGSDDFSVKCEEMEKGKSVQMDFEGTVREGLFDDDQLFAVYEKEDVEKLIKRLQKTLAPLD